MRRTRYDGVTLLELVLVLSIMSIIGFGVFSFLGASVSIYSDSQKINHSLAQAQFALERLTREIRQAVPNTIRFRKRNGLQCMEFLPIDYASQYASAPTLTPENSVQLDSNIPSNLLSSGGFLLINPTMAKYVYGAEPMEVSDVRYTQCARTSSQTMIDDNLLLAGVCHSNNTSPVAFPEKSAENRFYFSRGPVSYCFIVPRNSVKARFYRFSDYSTQSSIKTLQPRIPNLRTLLDGEVELLIDGVTGSQGNDIFSNNFRPFSKVSASNQRTILQIDFYKALYKENSTQHLHFIRQVQVRNVP